MWKYENGEDMEMHLRDSVKGIVTGQNGAGLKILLKIEDEISGEIQRIPVFGYWSSRVPVGAEATCSIKRWARDGKDILVTVDSVGYEYGMESAA